MGNLAFSLIGAKSTIFKVKLESGLPTHVNFSDHGVPKDAKILYINYTPHGGDLFPIEMHGNVPIRHLVPTEVNLWPRPSGAHATAASEVAIFLTWVRYSEDEHSWQSIVDAFEAFGQSRYDAAIVPANVAVELELSSLILSVLEPVVGKGQAEDFVDGGVPYSHQLNVLMPLIASTNHLGLLPDHIRGSLNRLRKLRNDVAHSGRAAERLERNEVAELLCAALFGFRYLQIIRSRLQPPPPSATT